MCELFAMQFSLPVGSSPYFNQLTYRSLYHPQGWGIGYYPDNRPAVCIIKEPLKASRSQLARFIGDYSIQSKIIIGHIRFATVGVTAFSNTQPYCREYEARDYVFMHNGKLENMEVTEGRFQPVGTTDSERAFCSLMNWLQYLPEKWNSNAFASLLLWFRKVNEKGQFNCVFSDGEYLFSYHDLEGYNGLYFTSKQIPSIGHEGTRVQDEQVNKGYVISTKPLTKEEEWQPFNYGQMLVCKNGEIVYDSLVM